MISENILVYFNLHVSVGKRRFKETFHSTVIRKWQVRKYCQSRWFKEKQTTLNKWVSLSHDGCPGLIRGATSGNADVILPLYIAAGTQMLEHYVQFWSSHIYKKMLKNWRRCKKMSQEKYSNAGKKSSAQCKT